MRMLAPDDAADVLQEMTPTDRPRFMAHLDDHARSEVSALLAYSEDQAGGLMNPRSVRVRPEMTVDEAVGYVRRRSRERAETISYLYVLDHDQKLQGVISFRDLFVALPDKKISDIMRRDVVCVPEEMDREEVARVIAMHDLVAVPVIDAERRMRGIVTVDDIVDVVQSEATEDIQKMGGMEALDAPYLRTSFWEMLRKRGGWLSLLFVGEMLTASAMGAFQDELAAAVVLALFIPLIISSGGNSGSQATTLVIRALALGELRLIDWGRVVQREAAMGIALGTLLAALGVLRILLWQGLFGSYGAHAGVLSLAVGLSVIGVVLWGTLAGSTLPFVLRRFRLDPASASAPLVATLVDVSGLAIYFTIARIILHGTLL